MDGLSIMEERLSPEAVGVPCFTVEEWRQIPWLARKKIVLMATWFIVVGWFLRGSSKGGQH